MNSIRLKTKYAEHELPIGTSKFFGNPDVPQGFEWPYIEVDGEEYDLSFIGQINLSEVAKYDKDGLLPGKGMLYFFYDLDEMPFSPDNLNACRVIYHESDENLEPMCFVDEDGEDLSFREMQVEFECVEAGFLDDEGETHLLLGEPSMDNGFFYECFDGWQMLFQLDSLETDDICINFTDEGFLCFYIDKEKLLAKDFSDVRIMQIYS